MDQYAPAELPWIVLRAAQKWPDITSKPIHSKSSTWHWAFSAISKQHKGNGTRTFCPSPTGENNSDRLFPIHGPGFTTTPFLQNRTPQLHNCPFKGYSMVGTNDRKTQNNQFFHTEFYQSFMGGFSVESNESNQTVEISLPGKKLYQGNKTTIGTFILALYTFHNTSINILQIEIPKPQHSALKSSSI